MAEKPPEQKNTEDLGFTLSIDHIKRAFKAVPFIAYLLTAIIFLLISLDNKRDYGSFAVASAILFHAIYKR